MPLVGLHPIVGMAIGVLVGGFLQLWVQRPSLRREGFRYRPVLDFTDPGLVRVGKLMLPAVIGLAAVEVNIFINTFFAASCAEGSVSWLNYAFRIMMFPIGLVGVSLSIATMPVVSRYAAQGDIQGLRQAYVSSTILSFVFSIPATVGLIVLAEPIIRVIYQHGRFTAADTAQTAGALALYAIGLFAYAAQKIVVPVFYSLNKTRYPRHRLFYYRCAEHLFCHDIPGALPAPGHRAVNLAVHDGKFFISQLHAVPSGAGL